MAKPRKRRSKDVLKDILDRLMAGESDYDIAFELGIDEEQFDAMKVEALKAKASEYRAKQSDLVYVEYVIEQRKTLAMLDSTIAALRQSEDPKTAPALVTAIRARSDVLNCLIDKGQTLGVISKAAEKSVVVGGFALEHASNDELQRLIVAELTGLQRIVEATATPIEKVKLPPLHYGEAGDENADIHIADEDDD